jgi:DNA primase
MSEQARDSIKDIKGRNPIEEVVGRFGVVLRPAGHYLKAVCPFHRGQGPGGRERTPSFFVSVTRQTWECFGGCGTGGDVFDFIGYREYGQAWNKRDKTQFKHVLEILEGPLPAPVQPIPPEWREKGFWKPVELTLETQLLLHTAARVYHTTLLEMGDAVDPRTGQDTPMRYLRQRGISLAMIRHEGIGYATGRLLGPALVAGGLSRAAAAEVNLLDPLRHSREFLAGRIVFIDRDRLGRVLHMIGRTFAPWMHADAPKYLSLKELEKPLHGYARLDTRESRDVVVFVESPPDRLTAIEWGFDALANTGTGLKYDHAADLARLPRPIAIVPHNDGGTGLQAAERWRSQVGRDDIRIVELPDAVKDLNELAGVPDGREQFVTLMRLAGFGPKVRVSPEQRREAERARAGLNNRFLLNATAMDEAN